MRSHRDARTLLPALRGALHDLQVTVERMSVVNDHIVTWSRLRGVNQHGIPALGIPANDLRPDVPWVTVDRMDENDEPARRSVGTSPRSTVSYAAGAGRDVTEALRRRLHPDTHAS